MSSEELQIEDIQELADKKPKPDESIQNRLIVSIENSAPFFLTTNENVKCPEETKKSFLEKIREGEITNESVAQAIALSVEKPDENKSWKLIDTDGVDVSRRMKRIMCAGLGISSSFHESMNEESLHKFLEKHNTPEKGAKVVVDALAKYGGGNVYGYALAGLKFLENSYGEQWKIYQQFKLLKKEALESGSEETQDTMESGHNDEKVITLPDNVTFERQNIPLQMILETKQIIDGIEAVRNGPKGELTEKIFGRSFLKEKNEYAPGNEPENRWGAMSRKQFAISKLPDGNLQLVDIWSTHGTSLNGELVEKSKAYPLKSGDVISFGTGHVGGKVSISI